MTGVSLRIGHRGPLVILENQDRRPGGACRLAVPPLWELVTKWWRSAAQAMNRREISGG